MRTHSIGQDMVVYKHAFKSAKAEKTTPPITDVISNDDQTTTKLKKDKVLPLVTATVAIAALGLATYAATSGKSRASKEIVEDKAKDAAAEAKRIAEEAKKAAEETLKDLKGKVEGLDSKLNETTNKTNQVEKTLNEKVKWYDGVNDGIHNKIDQLKGQNAVNNTPTERNLTGVDGLVLLQHLDNNGNRILPSTDLIKKIRGKAMEFITGKNIAGTAIAAPVLAAGASIWLPTAESLPEKEGGLGEIPVQIAKNFTKEVNVDSYIIRPLNEIPGTSSIIHEKGRDYYSFKNLSMPVDKVAEFETTAYRNGRYEPQKVEVYYGIDPKHGHKRLMFKNPTFFKASGLYTDSQTASEPERYAFFSKVVYDFAKLKTDPGSVTSYQIFNDEIYNSIKAPDAMVLNDWHTAPLAALLRVKAPFEAENKELSQSTADTFERMNLLYLVHNADYQGTSWNHSSEILNTLFDKYALDAYTNALTGFKTFNEQNQEVDMDTLRSALIIDNNVNMANMGMAYATKVAPVSGTYAKEMAEQPERGHSLQHISKVRQESGTMQGRSNGWDRSPNEVSKANIESYNNNINGDAFTKLTHRINEIKDLTVQQNKRVKGVFKEYAPKGLNINNFEIVIEKLLALNIPQIEQTIADLKNNGHLSLRHFKAETADMSMDEIMAARRHNKEQLVHYMKSIVNYNKENGEIFKLKGLEFTDLSDIDINKLDEIPIFNMGVRFVGQKGVDIACGAIYQIINDWDNLFPGKEKPIWAIGGKDPTTNGTYYNMVEGTKKSLQNRSNRLLQMYDFVPNNILMAGSDFTMRPSHFEPDGDKWESFYKGTPVILTNVGGHVDSVFGTGRGILTKRTVPQIHQDLAARKEDSHRPYADRFLDEQIKDYKEALIEALKLFYEDKDAYRKMVEKDIHGNQSWVQKDENGKIVECPIVAHMRDLNFNFKDKSFDDKFADNIN